MQRVLGLSAGLVIAGVMIAGLYWLGHQLFPWPAADFGDPASVEAMIEGAPMQAKIIAIGSGFLAALAGGLVASSIAQWRGAGWVITGIVALAAAAFALLIPQPQWMQAAMVASPLLAGLFVAGAY